MKRFLPLLAVLLVACSATATPAAIPTSNVVFSTVTASPLPPTPTRTPEPYAEYTIDHLRSRTYGDGVIEVLETLRDNKLFTSYSFRYPSDGLTIYGFVNVPKGKGPFPVIVSVHGYSAEGNYNPFDVEADYATFFTENQFVVVHPGLRNQPPSGKGDNLLRVGMSVDVLNLIALLKARNDFPAELTSADTEHLGLWGRSLGGEIGLRVITVSSDIQAAVFYSPMSGNIERNSRQLLKVIRDPQFEDYEKIPVQLFDRISPMYYYHKVTAAVQINHGTADTTAPMSWAAETCDFLKSAGVTVECIYYKNATHAFLPKDEDKFLQNALTFYKAYLTP